MSESGIPKRPDGTYDSEMVRLAFMASKHIEWTTFAEERGWDPYTSRREFPVRTWQNEKRSRVAEAQGDVISALIFERKYSWTKDLISTLDRYPKLIDKGSLFVEAKLNQVAEMYQEYIEWKKQGKHIKSTKHKRTGEVKEVRVMHPFEKISMTEMSMMMKGIKDITDAKLRALMIDKWASVKLDLQPEEIDPTPPEEKQADARPITIEGKSDFTFQDIQRWFDEFADKPDLTEEEKVKLAEAHAPAGTPPKPPAPKQTHKGVEILDDHGRPVKGTDD